MSPHQHVIVITCLIAYERGLPHLPPIVPINFSVDPTGRRELTTMKELTHLLESLPSATRVPLFATIITLWVSSCTAPPCPLLPPTPPPANQAPLPARPLSIPTTHPSLLSTIVP